MIMWSSRNGFILFFEEDIKAHNRYLMSENIRGAVRFIGVPDSANQTFSQSNVVIAEIGSQIGSLVARHRNPVSTNTLLLIGITAPISELRFVVQIKNTRRLGACFY